MGLIGAMTELLTWPGRRAYYGATNLEGFSATIKPYLDSMSLSEGMPAADGFDSYARARANSVDSFSKMLVSGGNTITEKLKEAEKTQAAAQLAEAERLVGAGQAAQAQQLRDQPTAARVVREEITDALKMTPETTTARTEFKETIAAITALIKDPESNYDPRNLVSYLTEVKTKACKAIEAQHTIEHGALKTKFDDEDFVDNLMSSLELTSPDQVEQVKKDMLAALTASQKTELETFTKSLDEPITKMHAEAQKERDRVAFLANLYEHNTKMRRVIDELYEKNRGRGGIQVEFDASDSSAKFKGIQVKDLPLLQSVCGRAISHSKDDNTFRMTLPNRFFSSSYFRGGLDRMKGDMMSMAMAVRATGADAITMTVKHPLDKEHAMELGREAYEACRRTGFDPKKITIEVNGKKMSRDELFANAPSRLKGIEDSGAAHTARLTEVAKGEHGTYTTEHFKNQVQERRQAARAAEAASAVAMVDDADEDQAAAPSHQ